ncbi:hypothetical protein KSS87_010884 [Heliosperma pusillum]|nr:hypothetical protein KSS87_010884 [Heliosperma pusillum]
MEKMKKIVCEIAYSHDFSKLSLLHRSLIPLLSLSSSFYSLSLCIRHHLYSLGIFHQHRLPVPVISVGNLTWGGNGKTPMVEFLSLWFSHSGICPLILSRGYAGGDEVRMLERHLLGTFVKVGVGANRAMTASWFLERYRYTDSRTSGSLENLLSEKKVEITSDKISAIILDDGMQVIITGVIEAKTRRNGRKLLFVVVVEGEERRQHLSLARDLDIVMVNGLTPWGNNRLVPLGPLRQPLSALRRADIVVIHHADLVSEEILDNLKRRIQEIKKGLSVFFSRMLPSHFLAVHDNRTKLPLSVVEHSVLLCVSAIGSPSAFMKCVQKLGPLHVDQLHFSDHHQFQNKVHIFFRHLLCSAYLNLIKSCTDAWMSDIHEMKKRLEELQNRFGSRPIIVTTEKDDERDPEAFLQLRPFEVLVLCSKLQLVSHNQSSEKCFKKQLKQLLDRNLETPAQVINS